jgi:molybdate transport system permease protein
VVLPLAALFAEGDLVAGLRSAGVADALRVSLLTSVAALAAMVVVGTPAAYLLARGDFRGRTALETLFELPLVLPPAAAGIGLLAAFGRRGLLGEELSALGVELPFTRIAVVLAMTFVAGPLYLRQAQAAFAALDADLLAASRTLGAGPVRTFLRVAVPVAAPGLGAGAALGWARAVGEFGATIIFAGNFPGVTQTASIAIYTLLADDFDAALALAAVLVSLSAAVLVAVKLLVRGGAPRSAPA